MGNGRTTGVLGIPGPESTGASNEVDDEEAELNGGTGPGLVSMMSSSEVSSNGGGISSLGSGGIGGSVVALPTREGNDAAGDGGGSTNEFVRCTGEGGHNASKLVLNSGSCLEGEGGIMGMTSVSYAGRTLSFRGEIALALSTDERRETRVLRPFTPFLSLRGDLRGDALGSIAAGMDGG